MTSHSLLQKLAAAGYSVGSLDELRGSGIRYGAAVPILLEELEATADPVEKEWLVRALSVPWAKPLAVAPLIAEFKRPPLGLDSRREGLRWAVGNALEVLWDDRYFDELSDLALDSRYGTARQMIVLGMRKSKRADVGEVLASLLHDDDVKGHAADALVKHPTELARAGLTDLLSSKFSWQRRAAAKALKVLDENFGAL